MKRDMDLARQILMDVEECKECTGHGWVQLNIDGRSKDEIAYHVMLLHEAGLIEARDVIHSGPDGFNWFPKRLTWAGHEFLDAAREEGLWQRAKNIAKEKAGGLSFDVLKAILLKLATDAVLGG